MQELAGLLPLFTIVGESCRVVAKVGVLVAHTDRRALVIQHVLNAAVAIQKTVVRVFKRHPTRGRSFDRAGHPDCVVAEVGIHRDAMASEVSYTVRHVEANVALVRIVGLGNVVGQLALVEPDLTVVAIPLNEISKRVLREETVCLNVVSVDLQAVLDVVLAIVDEATDVVVSPPEPSVVDDDILVVDLNHALGGDLILIAIISSADSGEDIGDHTRCRLVSFAWIRAPLQ